jgi:hypothetical protein
MTTDYFERPVQDEQSSDQLQGRLIACPDCGAELACLACLASAGPGDQDD